jgi:hypothetical protein
MPKSFALFLSTALVINNDCGIASQEIRVHGFLAFVSSLFIYLSIYPSLGGRRITRDDFGAMKSQSSHKI